MLKISKSQMEALRQTMRAEFIRRTLAILREAAPGFLAGLDEATALRRVEDSVARAESYGLFTERQIRDLIAIQTVAGEGFDGNPRFAAARGALTDVSLPPDERLAQARQSVAEVLAAERTGDER